MASLEVFCPLGHCLQVTEAQFHQTVNCPTCNTPFVVPDLGTVSDLPAAASGLDQPHGTTMRHLLGRCCYALTIAFAVGLFLSMACVAWCKDVKVLGVVAFFGFGVPMVMLGLGTAALWWDSRTLTQLFGWTCIVAALVWAVGLLFLVGGWVGVLPGPREMLDLEAFGLFFGFGVPMLVCGYAGIARLGVEGIDLW